MTSKPDQCGSISNLEWKLPQANGFNAWEDANSSSPWLKNIDHCCLIQGLHKLWAQYTTTIISETEIPWKNCLINSNNKEQLLIYILFSKSGLAGQHNYLTPIVSMSFSLTLNVFVYLRAARNKYLCSSGYILLMLLLLHAPETHTKGVSNILFIKARNTYFRKEWSFCCHIGPTLLLFWSRFP
jgi:hypothetical protein